MKIALVNAVKPFEKGPTEALADQLNAQLQARGFHSAIINVPFTASTPEKVLEQLLAFRLLKFDYIDVFVALKFPAYYIPHANKVIWIQEAFGGISLGCNSEEKSENGESKSMDSEKQFAIQDMIQQSEYQFIKDAKRVFSGSNAIKESLLKQHNLYSNLLQPPEKSLEGVDNVGVSGSIDKRWEPILEALFR